METELKDSVLHLGEKQFSDGKNNSLGEDVQPEVFCNASVDEEQNGNGCSSQVKSALVQNRAPRHCPDGDQADLGGSSQLDQQPGTERELDGSPGTDVETNKESLLSGSFSSFESCRESLSSEENICTLDSGSIGYAEKEFQEHLLESCLSDFGSSGSSGLVDLSMSCMDHLIGTLDFPQPDSYQQKEPEQDDEVPEDDQCPMFSVSCVTSSTVNNLPGNAASAVEQPTAGVTEAPNENVCRSDQQSQMVLVTTTESPDNDESQLSSHRDFYLDKEKDHGLHNDSHADGLGTNSYKGVFSLSHDNKLHGATEQRDENCEEDVKSSGMCEKECVNNTMHPGVDKQQGMVARQDFKNFKSSDLSLLTAASGGAKSNQLLSKEHEQVLQMLGLSDSVDVTANPADSDLVMSSSSQEEDSPAAPPVDKNAQILPSVSDHCEQGTSESDMDPRPSERDTACMQHGFFFNIEHEDIEFPPTYDSDSNTSVTSSCDSPPNGLHVQETSRQNACEAAECTATSKVDSVGQTEQMPCSIDKYITKAKDGTMKPDADAEDSPIKPDVDAELSPFSSFGDFSMHELPAEVTEGKEQVRAISSICCQEADNADVYGREDLVPQKALFGNNAHKSREDSTVFDSENSDSIFDAENRHWGSGNHMDLDSDPASSMQNNSSYRPVAAPRSKMLGQAASCFSAGLLGSQEPQPKSGLQDQRRATETACSDLSQSSFIKPLQDRGSPDHLSSLQNAEVDLFMTGSSSPDMSEHSPDSSKGILHSGYHHQLTGSPFTVTQNTAKISHESPAVPSFGFGQSSFTPQPQQSQSFETDHARVQSVMQEKTHNVYMNPDWSVIIPDNTHAQPSHTPGTSFHPSPQESQFTTQSQSCFALQAGKKPQLGPHNSQSSLWPNLHQPEEQKWQTAENIMQNQMQEEHEVELKTVVVTGPSLGPEHEELCSLYFENSKRSGGGEIQEDGIRWDEERKCFFITFLDSQAAKNVTSREHTLKKSPIQVELWSSSQQCGYTGGLTMPMSEEASTPSAPAHYKDRVLVSGVPSETTSDFLLNYLECVADVAVENIINKEGDSVLVIFKSSEQDFNVREMLSACEENPLSPGVHMTFKEVPLPRAVFVTGLKTSTVDDAIRLYFSNKRRNGGGPVEKVERASDRSAVVYFKNCDDAVSVAKKGNHTLDGNELQVTLGTKSDEEDSPGQHKATRGFPAAGANESSSDDEESGGWSEDAASVAKKGNHTLDGNELQVTLGTESDEEDSPGQHKATRGFPAAEANESSSDDEDSGGWSEGPIPCENDYSNCHNHSHRGADLIPCLSHSSSAPQARTTKIKLSEQSLRRVMSDSSLLRKLTSALKSVDGKFHWKQPDGIIITCLNGQPPHDWEHQVGKVVEQFFQELKTAVPTARSAPQKPDSAPQARTTKIKLSEQSLRRVMSDSSLLRKLTSALKSVDGKFHWKQPDGIIITCLNGQPPHDWEHQVGRVVEQFFQEIETEVPTARSAPQKPDRNNSSSEMHETPMPSLASSHSVTKRLMPATDILEDTICHLKPCQLKVLRIPTALEKFIKGYPGLEVTVDEVTKMAKVRAPEDVMTKAFSNILAFVTLLREVKIRLSPALVEMYKKEDTKDWIHTALIGKYELVCHWELCDDLIVLSGQSSDLSRLEKMFRSAFEETKVAIEKKEQCLLKIPAWLSFLESLQESRAKYPTPVVLPEGCNIIIVDTPSNVTKTCLKLKTFFDENQLEEKTLRIDQNHLKFLKHYCTEEIKEVHKRAKGMGVSVNFNKTGMVAEGPKDNLPGTVREVKELVSRIKEDKMTFKKPGAAKYLTGDKGQEFLQQTGQATECFITTSDDGKMSSTHSVGRVLAEVKLGADQQLLIVQGDITQCEVDGIVNAANGQLNHGGGVAAAIVEAGGISIQEESDELIAKQGDLSEGEVVVTGAGSLECSWILHAVGPTWKRGLKDEDQLLKRTVLVTLKKAQEMKMKSIAMPAISCGIFCYPVDQATHIILQAIGSFFTEDRRDSCLKTVMLIDMNDKTLHSFLSAGKMLFGEQLQVKDQPKPTTHSSRHRDDHKDQTEQGAAKNVTSREHTLKKSPIQVELWSPSQQCGYTGGLTMPMSEEASTPSAPAHYKDRVLVSGVPSETTSDFLLNYLECVADVAVENIINKEGDSVLVIFKFSEQDFNVREMLSACEENPLSPGVHMTFKEVPLPRAVFVTGLKTSTVDDAIRLYFSNKRRNGGGPVEKVERASDRSAVVYFKNCDDAVSVAKKGNHTLDGNELQVTLGTKSDEEDSPGQHKATRGFPAAGANESSSDDEESGGWSEDAASVAKKGNHTLDGNELQVTLGTESDEEDSPGQHKATRGFPAAEANESSSDDEDSGGWSEGPIPCENDYSNCHNHSHRGADLIPCLSHSSSAPQARTTKIKLSEQSLRRVMSDSSLLRKLTSALKSVDGKFHWKQPDGVIITCLNGQPPHDWEHQVGKVVEQFFQELKTAVPTARSALQKPDSAPQARTTKIKLSEQSLRRVMSDSSLLRKLTSALKSVDGKFHWKQPDGVIITCLNGQPPHDWEHQVGKVVEQFFQELKTAVPTARSALQKPDSAPQARTTKIKLSEQSLRRVMSDSSLLRKLTSALKSVDGKFHWKQPDGIIITCLNGQPPHDWEHQVGRVVEQFFQEIETEVPTARSAPQKPDRNNSSSEMHETPMPSLASSHSVTKRLMPATDILEDTICHLKPCQLKVLRIPTALEKVIKGYPGLEVTVDEVTKMAKVRAPEDVMTKAFSNILAFVTLLREVKIRLSPALVEMYKKEDTKDWIHTALIGKHELVCHWELCDDLIVLSGQSSDLSRLEKMFRSAFEETKVAIEKKEQCLLKIPAWLSFLESLQESRAKYPTPVVLPEGCNIIIVDTPSNVTKTCLKLKTFFDENQLEEKTLRIDQNHLKFLKHYCTEEIKEVHKKAKGMGVSVNFNKTGMVAEGPKDNLPGTVREVKELVSRIKEDKMTFKKPGAAKYLTGDKGQEFLQQTGQATECFITTSDDGKMSSTHSVGRVLAEVKLGADQQLLIVQGDITQCEVDGIVNAANGQLNHGGGVAAAIVEAGGISIQEESDELIAKQGDLSEGEVVVTGAGSLECSWILHAVGPTWKRGLKDEDQLLKRTVLVTLKKAQEMKMKSIAMPAISCGIFHYPVDQATHIILQAIGSFFTEDRRDSCLKTVMLIDMNDKTLHSFLSAGKMLFGEQLQVKDQPKPTTHSSRHRDDHKDQTEQGASHGSHSDDAHSDRSHPPIKIISGEIAKSRADVIVCTLHPSLDLRKGVLSKGILEEGGETIQQELRKFNERHGPARIGSVVRTSGGNLRCKYLFHLSLPTWRDDRGQKMQSAVKECLEEASRKRARSIAFPTLGTGKLGYPGNQVAAIMFSVISKWLQDHRDSSVKEVQIIVFSKDNETLQDFKAVERGGGSHTGGRGHGHRDRGGDTALSGGQSNLKIKMGKITVMVKVGDILTEPCDAIVNSSNDDLDLSRGVLSKAILKVGGKGIVAECRDQKEQMADTGVAVTSVESSQLSCGSVIHVSADRFKRDWHRGILTVLRTADAEGIQSVALPALGTGGRGADPQALAQAMQEAVSQFASRAHSVKEVRVVVFQKQMLQPYIAAFSASSSGAEGSDSDAETSPRSKQKMWQEVDVYIYSSQESAVRNAREKIYKHMKDISVSHTEKDSLIVNFDSKQVEELFKLQNKHKVDIMLDKKKSAVTVTGIDIDVAKAVSDLKGIMLSASKQHHLAAGLPPVRWQYETGKDKFADFDPENTVIIEAAFKKRERSVHITDKRGRQYKIDLKDRKEYCIGGHHALPVAVKRRDLLQEKKDEIPLPKHWAPMKGEKVKLVSLSPDCSEYKKVAQHFGGRAAVKKIERIQNPSLFQQFKVKKRELELYNPKGTENEKRLFHGTSSDSIKGIIANGFNRSYCGKNGTALGAGVYFAADSGTSMGFAQGQMFQARVLVGEYTPGNSSMRMAPNKPNSDRPYDSVSNAASNATVFVIFHDSQAYPEYLISF